MLSEYNEVKRYFQIRFGDLDIPDGIYAIPTQTSRGNAFMRMEIKDKNAIGKENFMLFWDEKLTVSWYNKKKPFFLRESKFSKVYRKLLSLI